MTRRFAAFALVLALPLLAASPGRAGTAGYDIGLVRPGMPLAELRHATWPKGARLLCNGDSDLPAKVDSPPEGGINMPPRLVGSGLIPCALFAPDAGGTWKMTMADFAGAPAGIWVLGVADKPGDEPRLVQAKLWQSGKAFKATVAFVTGRLGPASFATKEGSRWANADGEVIVGHTSKGGIYTIVTDKGLEAEVGKIMDKVLPAAAPKGASPH